MKSRKSGKRGANRKAPLVKKIVAGPSFNSATKRRARSHWDELTEALLDERQRRRNRRDLTPFDKPDAYLKREVYALVRDYLRQGRQHLLEELILESRYPYAPRSPSFGDNPFHWVFFGMRDPTTDNLRKDEVSRFGRQLLYAHRHRIEPELLIGFLHQSGTPDEIATKVADPDRREDWYFANMATSEPSVPRTLLP